MAILGLAMVEILCIWYLLDTDATYETMSAVHKKALC
jgi:hypothetical protein